MTDLHIPPALLAAYREAEYIVQAADARFSISIDIYSASLEALHRQYHTNSSAVITAYNPRSKRLAIEENDLALQNLEARLVALGYTLLPATGHDQRHQWPDEPGFLVLGISRDAAKKLGAQYNQNAVLYCGSNAVPELVLSE